MRHPTIPVTLTPEALGQWIMKTKIEMKTHVDKVPLEQAQIIDLEHKSSLASRAIDRLESQLKTIKAHFANGTVDPVPLTIYPTKGLKALEANRKFADDCIAKGYTEESTMLYGIPWPERDQIVYVDIEGEEFEDYRQEMDIDQKSLYGGSLFKEEESLQESVSKEQKSKRGGKKKQPIEGFTFQGGDGTQENPATFTKDQEDSKLPFD